MAKIDQNKCLECGICANICPEGIVMNFGKAQIKDDKAACLSEASNACPIDIIDLE